MCLTGLHGVLANEIVVVKRGVKQGETRENGLKQG